MNCSQTIPYSSAQRVADLREPIQKQHHSLKGLEIRARAYSLGIVWRFEISSHIRVTSYKCHVSFLTYEHGFSLIKNFVHSLRIVCISNFVRFTTPLETCTLVKSDHQLRVVQTKRRKLMMDRNLKLSQKLFITYLVYK